MLDVKRCGYFGARDSFGQRRSPDLILHSTAPVSPGLPTACRVLHVREHESFLVHIGDKDVRWI
jgi:hypothetical protein